MRCPDCGFVWFTDYEINGERVCPKCGYKIKQEDKIITPITPKPSLQPITPSQEKLKFNEDDDEKTISLDGKIYKKTKTYSPKLTSKAIATVIDNLFISIVSGLSLYIPLITFGLSDISLKWKLSTFFMLYLLNLLNYNVFFISLINTTPGRLMLKIRFKSVKNENVEPWRIVLKWFLSILFNSSAGIGLIYCLMDEEGLALSDRITGISIIEEN